jgi:hypothetical protein
VVGIKAYINEPIVYMRIEFTIYCQYDFFPDEKYITTGITTNQIKGHGMYIAYKGVHHGIILSM